jgi:hypothetical protein
MIIANNTRKPLRGLPPDGLFDFRARIPVVHRLGAPHVSHRHGSVILMSTAWQAPLDYVPQNERAEAWTVMIDAVFTLSCPVCCAPADPVARESVNMESSSCLV